MHVVWYTAMSMDGRIAGRGDSLDFLGTLDAGGEPSTTGGDGASDFDTFIASVDAVVVGATTLRWLHDHGHALPHDRRPTWVLSHDESLVRRAGTVEVPVRRFEGDIDGVFADIAAAGHRRVWLSGGGDVAAQALAADRVDEVVVTIAPTVLGAGPALFDGEGLPQRRFRLVTCVAQGDAARVTWRRARD